MSEKAAKESTPAAPTAKLDDYMEKTKQPLQSLLFLLPLLIAYEIGSIIYATDFQNASLQSNKAKLLIFAQLENFFGDLAYFLPGLLMIGLLLGFHFYHKHKLKVYPWATLVMWVESIVLTLPLIVFALMWLGTVNTPRVDDLWKIELVFSVGAGIYEELLFRLIGLSFLMMLFQEIIKLDKMTSAVLGIGITSALFALYHYQSIDQIRSTQFLFYTIAGVYFGILYIARGFGIVVATHAIYDVVVVAINYGLIRISSSPVQ